MIRTGVFITKAEVLEIKKLYRSLAIRHGLLDVLDFYEVDLAAGEFLARDPNAAQGRPISELDPQRRMRKGYRVLKELQPRTIEELLSHPFNEVMRLHRCGPTALREILQALVNADVQIPAGWLAEITALRMRLPEKESR